MTDLTLNEFRGLSGNELKQAFKEEERKMFGSNSLEKNYEEKVNDSYSLPFISRCWSRCTTFFQVQ